MDFKHDHNFPSEGNPNKKRAYLYERFPEAADADLSTIAIGVLGGYSIYSKQQLRSAILDGSLVRIRMCGPKTMRELMKFAGVAREQLYPPIPPRKDRLLKYKKNAEQKIKDLKSKIEQYDIELAKLSKD